MDIFNKIYKYNLWGFGSGTGSIAYNNKEYINFITKFIKEHNIESIVDIGCGDWQLFSKINLNSTRYIGIDTVKEVVTQNIQKYSSPNIKFICQNVLDDFTPPNAALYIVKDVLQHWSNDNIDKFFYIMKNTRFKYILIINDTTFINLNKLNIKNGFYRPFDISKYNLQYKNTIGKNVMGYYDKLYIIAYLISFILLIYMIYNTRYKLYILTFISLVLYGVCFFPYKRVFIIMSLSIK